MDLERLLRPRTIAVFGGRQAAEVVRQCQRIGFGGEIWPVHPRRAELAGRPCFRTVADLPAAPDAAFIGVNRELSIDLVRALAGRGAGGAVCYAAGFAEAGEAGAQLQRELIAAAGAMPILGPNCYGCLNLVDGVALWPDQQGAKRVPRGVGLVLQSSNVAINLTMQRRGLPLAYVICLGNQASIGLPDAIRALAADDRVSAIGLHIEGLGDPLAFAAAVREAGKPVVAIGAGRTRASAGLTQSHTASLAGRGEVLDAFLERAGVARAGSLPVLLETLKLLHVHGPLPGADLVSLSCSGGEAALMADVAAGRAVRFRPFAANEAARVRATVDALVAIGNPFDYHTFMWGDRGRLEATFGAVLGCGFDLGLLVLDLPREDRCDAADWRLAAEAFVAAGKRCRARTAIVASLPEGLPEAEAERLIEEGTAPLCGLDDALAAIEAAASLGATARAFPPPSTLTLPREEQGGSPATAVTTLPEWAGKAQLALFGVAHPGCRLVHSVDEAVAAAAPFGGPVVLKATGSELVHKSEAGAVALGLRSEEGVRAAAARLLALAPALLIEPMISDAVAELIVGAARDPVVGLHLVVGAGGVLVELLDDRQVLLLPTSAEATRRALGRLRIAPLLAGYRGRPAGDVDAAIAAVLAIARFAEANRSRLLELDVNPLLVRPAGLGVVAADVLIRIASEDHADVA